MVFSSCLHINYHCIIFRPEIRYIVTSVNEMTGVPMLPEISYSRGVSPWTCPLAPPGGLPSSTWLASGFRPPPGKDELLPGHLPGNMSASLPAPAVGPYRNLCQVGT